MRLFSEIMANKNLLIMFLAVSSFIGTGCSKDPSPTSNTGNSGGDTGGGTITFIIDTIAQNGQYPAIAIDKNGKPHVSFIDLNDKYVKYAYKNSSSWTVSSIEYAAATNTTLADRGLSSIALDSQNNPYVCFMSALGFDPTYGTGQTNFKYSNNMGTGWTTSIIPLPDDPKMSYASPFIPCTESSIAVDTNTGTVHISLHMNGGLSGGVLGYWKTGFTEATIVDAIDGNSGHQNSIALDANGYPSISYESRQTGHLKFSRWNGSVFNIEPVDTMPGVYWQNRLSSLAIDQNSNPHIAYVGIPGYDYKYAYKNAGSWNIGSLSENSGYPSISLCLDAAGKPHIALATTNGNLRYGYLNGTSWSFTTVDNNISYCAIAADKSGKIHIVYSQQIGANIILKHAVK